MTDATVLERMHEMCTESLSPDKFEQWDGIRSALLNTRKSLSSCCKVCNHAIEPAWLHCPECGSVLKDVKC